MSNSDPIWKLVHSCAQELTKSGLSPFTRGDIIKCIQKKAPRYEENSINPIIQGVTDNLKGGAPGAVGKNLLHSVGRGLFELKTASSIGTLTGNTSSRKAKSPKSTSKPQRKAAPFELVRGNSILVGGYSFGYICDIAVRATAAGEATEFLPQSNYNNLESLTLNKYGKGPFCKFNIPNNLKLSGVYIIGTKHRHFYVGECLNLSHRFNMGYGNISPRNCYVGGQETNCRLNHLVLQEYKSGNRLSLWFHQTDEYKSVEAALRRSHTFPWNRI